jgi:hypothetical protein
MDTVLPGYVIATGNRCPGGKPGIGVGAGQGSYIDRAPDRWQGRPDAIV